MLTREAYEAALAVGRRQAPDEAGWERLLAPLRTARPFVLVATARTTLSAGELLLAVASLGLTAWQLTAQSGGTREERFLLIQGTDDDFDAISECARQAVPHNAHTAAVVSDGKQLGAWSSSGVTGIGEAPGLQLRLLIDASGVPACGALRFVRLIVPSSQAAAQLMVRRAQSSPTAAGMRSSWAQLRRAHHSPPVGDYQEPGGQSCTPPALFGPGSQSRARLLRRLAR